MTLYIAIQSLPGAAPPGSPVLSWVWFIVLGVLAGLAGLFYLLASRKQSIEGVTQKTVQTLKDAITARDVALTDGSKRVAEIESDLKQMTTEYTALVGIDIKEILMFAEKAYWAELKSLRADNVALVDELARAERRVKHLESGGSV